RWINEAKKAREQYDTIKGKFEVVDCKRCGTKRINNTWNKLDFVSMAKETGDLGILLAQAYYEPLNLAHSTAEAFWLRLTLSEAGDLGFDPGPQPKDADRALQLAHAILIVLLQVQQRHFKMSNLVELINVCVRDFEDIWPGRGLEVDPLKP
ncbi:MAG: hypothetical protein ACLPSO_00725, partial [Terracidiphilus sp.]